MMRYLIIGLGNPGSRYKLTRHNVGFMVVDALVQELNAPPFKVKKRFHALVTQTIINDQLSMIIAKPHTFMNLSGTSVVALTAKFRYIDISKSLIVVSDDLDLPLGTIRYREEGSAGGHNGLQSIIDALGTTEFPRLKIGIRPPHLARQPGKAERFVLEKFTTDEMKRLKERIIPEAIQVILERIKSQYQNPNVKL